MVFGLASVAAESFTAGADSGDFAAAGAISAPPTAFPEQHLDLGTLTAGGFGAGSGHDADVSGAGVGDHDLAASAAALATAPAAASLAGGAAAEHAAFLVGPSDALDAGHGSEFLFGPDGANFSAGGGRAAASASRGHSGSLSGVGRGVGVGFAGGLERGVGAHGGAFPEVWSDEMLAQRRTQLRVAMGISASTFAASVGLFARFVYQLAKKRLDAEAAAEEEFEASDQPNEGREGGDDDDDQTSSEKNIGAIRCEGLFLSGHEADLGAGRRTAGWLNVPLGRPRARLGIYNHSDGCDGEKLARGQHNDPHDNGQQLAYY